MMANAVDFLPVFSIHVYWVALGCIAAAVITVYVIELMWGD